MNKDLTLIDSHAHLELDPLFGQVDKVIDRAREQGVRAIICIGIDEEDSRRVLDIVDRFGNVYAGMGFHPHNAKQVDDNALTEMQKMAAHPKVKGYGEIGLDFFRDLSPRDTQIAVFADQLVIAQRLEKPVIIHLRNAYDKGLEMLEQAAPFPNGGVIHCFSGNEEDAKRALELGFYISVPGTVTYKKNEALRSIVANIPAERLLLETDCPYLSPEPFRGKDNEPAFIMHTAKKVAELKGLTVEEIGWITSENAVRLFDLPEGLIK
jgi:TatD DNase family protein